MLSSLKCNEPGDPCGRQAHSQARAFAILFAGEVVLCYLVLARDFFGGILIGRPTAANTASRKPSLRVGWGWMVSAISSTVSSPRMATEYSLMRLVASGPMIWAPSNSPYLPMITLVNPSVSAIATALPLADQGKRSTRASGYFALA